MADYKALADRLQEPGPGTEDFYAACDEAAAILRRLDAAQPVEYQILVLGTRWTHCAKHIYDMATDRSTVRALYASPVEARQPAPKEPSHV